LQASEDVLQEYNYLPGNVIDENYSLLLLENSDIDLTTAVLLDKVQKGKLHP
jgi:hypothetical protein